MLSGALPPTKYIAELRNSAGCLSCFGWGEICYRDFESIVCGAVLIKPTLAPIETWPDLFKENDTYVPFKWDFSDFEQIIQKFANGEFSDTAQNAREKYANALSKDGMQAFRERFASIVYSTDLADEESVSFERHSTCK
jgi:hypothetical protein